MECGDADILQEKLLSAADEGHEDIFQKRKEFNYENTDSNNNNDLRSTDQIRRLPAHKDALHCAQTLQPTNLSSSMMFIICVMVRRQSQLHHR
jgi:hypothetical protein